MKLDITVPIQISTNIWQASLHTRLSTESISMQWLVMDFLHHCYHADSLALRPPLFHNSTGLEEQQKAKNAWSHLSRAWYQVDGCKVDVLEGGQKKHNQALYSWSNSRCSCDGNYLGSLVRNSLSSLVYAYLKMTPPMSTSNFLTSCMWWIRPAGLYLFFHFSLCNMVNTSRRVGGFGMRLANNFDMYVDILTSCILS